MSNERAKTGIEGLDQVIDEFRMGDNVVWQVDSVADYQEVVKLFMNQAKTDGRKRIYIRFGNHEPLFEENEIYTYTVDASLGFEYFASEIHKIITKEGKDVFYAFDCLTDLLDIWNSDLMTGNFFKVTCPYLYEQNTIAYFSLKRPFHTYETIARIRETTQILLDLYYIEGEYYIHPLKVWERYSPTMFFPHHIKGQKAVCITSSAEASSLFSNYNFSREIKDYWDTLFDNAEEKDKEKLIQLLMGRESRTFQLCKEYFSLEDVLSIKDREIGTGHVGGKTVGMLLARKILMRENPEEFHSRLEMHDSFYLGADVFYTYIVTNDCWKLRISQKTKEGYFDKASELQEKIREGRFYGAIKEDFLRMLQYFGQSPIIVRSSSLLEDNFGNAFAGKYDSFFLANQGTLEERYAAFEEAIKKVYASTMNPDALNYRKNRGLSEKDEQMAILIQRVSGDFYGQRFFPHIAGVGNSSNLYVWDSDIDMSAGMLRLVFGLGTRAVDRIAGDYPRIVCLDDPGRTPLISYGDEKKFSQHYLDLIQIEENKLGSELVEEIIKIDIKTDKSLFIERDYDAMRMLRDRGRNKEVFVLNFKKLLTKTDFPKIMRDILQLLSQTYDYPVDIEFTANFNSNGDYKINLLQCRPLQTRGLGKTWEIPEPEDVKDILFYIRGNFMGGNVRLKIDYIVYVNPKEYLALGEREKYETARTIGIINEKMKGKNAMAIGPGRWGTTTVSLGVPVHFTEICNMSVVCEVAYVAENFMPELSYGSHFFQDLVESGIFYCAIFNGDEKVMFNEDRLIYGKNLIKEFADEKFDKVIRVISVMDLELYSDTVTQKLLCAGKIN